MHRAAVLILAALIGIVGIGFLAANRKPVPPSSTVQASESSRVPQEMVYVPGGECIIGTNDLDADEDVRPAHRVFVPSFSIDRTEVTNAEYKRIVLSHTYPPNEDALPVTNVTYDEAAAYAQAVGKRLPTEDEWEKAARGTDGRRYPWGDVWDAKRVAPRARTAGIAPPIRMVKRPGQCAIGTSRVRQVGYVPSGVSPYGCVDMAGNAWEWVQGFYHGNPEQRILRGGAVGYGERDCRTYAYAVEGRAAT